MKTSRILASALAALTMGALAAAPGCSGKDQEPAGVKPVPVTSIPGHDSLAQDTAPKESPRMVPPEAYLRTYLQIFGGKTPLEVQALAKPDQLFDVWADYLNLIGLPDYGTDIPRGSQTNALMMATFERLGVALCDRTLENDLKSSTAVAVEDRRVFAFELTPEAPDASAFAERFDVMHRTFIGYPAALATTDRTARFFKLYNDTVARHEAEGAPKSKFTPAEAGWAAVCYGLVRHPEFHLY